MKNNDDNRLLENKRRIDEQRRQKAIHRRKQEALRNLTPGVATPGSVRTQMQSVKFRKATGQ